MQKAKVFPSFQLYFVSSQLANQWTRNRRQLWFYELLRGIHAYRFEKPSAIYVEASRRSMQLKFSQVKTIDKYLRCRSVNKKKSCVISHPNNQLGSLRMSETCSRFDGDWVSRLHRMSEKICAPRTIVHMLLLLASQDECLTWFNSRFYIVHTKEVAVLIAAARCCHGASRIKTVTCSTLGTFVIPTTFSSSLMMRYITRIKETSFKKLETWNL